MNTQIEKLFEQALEEFKAENKYATIVVPDTLQRDFVGKFAELIVRECVKVAMRSVSDDEPKEAWYLIQEHFGVKE